MNLTNQQTEALTDLLVRKEVERIKPINENNLIKAKEKVSKRAKELMKIYKTIPKDLIELMYNNKKLDESYIIENTYDVEKLRANREDIKAKLILGAIECKTISELKKKFKIDF